MAALVERQNPKVPREAETHQVPGMGGLVAAMQQHDGRGVDGAPFQEMEAVMAQDDVVGAVARALGEGDAQIGRARLQAGEFGAAGHVMRRVARGEFVEKHDIPYFSTTKDGTGHPRADRARSTEVEPVAAWIVRQAKAQQRAGLPRHRGRLTTAPYQPIGGDLGYEQNHPHRAERDPRQGR